MIKIADPKEKIKRIDRVINTLILFEPSEIKDRSDPNIRILEDKLDKLLVDIFGHNTADYNRYWHLTKLDTAPIFDNRDTDIKTVIQALIESKQRSIGSLTSIKEDIIQEIDDTEQNKASKIISLYQGLKLHPEISAVSDELYKNGHFAEAAVAAVKKLINLVKKKSEQSIDGSNLMQRVFSINNPILKFSTLTTQSERDEQLGYMNLFTGAVLAIRNPRSHEFIEDDPEEVLEFIIFISHLTKRLDKAIK